MSFFGKVRDLVLLFAAIGLVVGVLFVGKSTSPETTIALVLGGAAIGAIIGGVIGIRRKSGTSDSNRR